VLFAGKPGCEDGEEYRGTPLKVPFLQESKALFMVQTCADILKHFCASIGLYVAFMTLGVFDWHLE